MTKIKLPKQVEQYMSVYLSATTDRIILDKPVQSKNTTITYINLNNKDSLRKLTTVFEDVKEVFKGEWKDVPEEVKSKFGKRLIELGILKFDIKKPFFELTGEEKSSVKRQLGYVLDEFIEGIRNNIKNDFITAIKETLGL